MLFSCIARILIKGVLDAARSQPSNRVVPEKEPHSLIMMS